MQSYRIIPLFLVAFLPCTVMAAETAQLTAPDRLAKTLDVATLAQLPSVEIASAHRSAKGIETGLYKGVLLWDLLAAKGLRGDPKAALRHVVRVSAGDGHAVVFPMGEMAPDLCARPILLAYQLNGAPLPDGLRMVVPGDLRGARHIKDIVALEYR